MKKYKLLKDLPFAKAGDIFRGELEYGTTVLFPEDYENYEHKLSSDEFWDFNEWFEEIKELELPKEFFYINIDIVTGYNYSYFSIDENTRQEYIRFIERYKSVGNYFETRDEAEKYLEYLKAKAIIKEDTKGFKPNWKNCENKYYGYWDSGKNSFDYLVSYITKYSDICFKTEEDIEESLKKHPEEWKAYLTYEG